MLNNTTYQCGLFYFGYTKRDLKCGIKEHSQYIRKQEINESDIKKYCCEMDHIFGFNSSEIISKSTFIVNLIFYRIKEHNQYIRKQETIKSHIKKHCCEMNHDFGFNSFEIIS